MDLNNSVLEARSSDRGMGQLGPDQFEAALLELTEVWLRAGEVTPVVACGMVGARTGWIEAEYRTVPAKPVSSLVTRAPCIDPRHEVSIIAGMSQAEPADVMRGEETQIAGFLLSDAGFDGTICMPGTHTKWVRVDDGQVMSFRTVMTGEVFALLSKKSVLRQTVDSDQWDQKAFEQAVSVSTRAPSGLMANLFSVRSAALVNGHPPETCKARLSGLLVGSELAAAKGFWDGTKVRILGGAGLARLYADALSIAGASFEVLDGEKLTLDGLTAAYLALKGA